MNIAIVHQDVTTGGFRPDDVDVLAQADLVRAALERLGHDVCIHSVTLDLAALRAYLRDRNFDFVFNLVESLGGHGRLIHLVPSLVEADGIPITGCGSLAIALTTDKVLAKKWMRRSGLPTPDWIVPGLSIDRSIRFPSVWVIKPLWEDASVGIDDDAVVSAVDDAALLSMLEARAASLTGAVFAERFVDGREFNLSMLDGSDGPEVLPVAEIEFVDYPKNKPRIVGYAAKWNEDSFEYHATPRRFDFAERDRALVDGLRATARACWNLFGLAGYARVDFRVDEDGTPWILEVNANPCLSPDAGFMAAAHEAGYDATKVIERLVVCALQPSAREATRSHA